MKLLARAIMQKLYILPLAVSFVFFGILCVLVNDAVVAQEQFYTQSGGRGLQNAKLNARMSKNEKDVGDLQLEMAKVKPHAKMDIPGCGNNGDKLRWDGSRWVCDTETDPTVQAWAKESLPSCGVGQILGVSGGRFGCQSSSYVTAELDPTVQTWAKQALPGCSSGEVLGVGAGGTLICIADDQGLTRETDPLVHTFARTDGPALPNCSSNEVLTMRSGALSCKTDSLGITVEADPLVQSFARKDISGYTLAACAAGEILRSSNRGSDVILECVDAATTVGSSMVLDDLGDVSTAGASANKVLMFDGTSWVAAAENDPNVPAWARVSLPTCSAGQVLGVDGSGLLTCVNDAGGSAEPIALGGLSDVNVSGVTSDDLLIYNGSKWVPLDIPTCNTGEVLTWTGGALSCVADAGGASNPILLNDLGDVVVTGATNNQLLRFNGSNWVSSNDKVQTLTAGRWCRTDGSSVLCDVETPLTCATDEVLKWNGSGWQCVNVGTGLGLGTMAQQDADNVDVTGGLIDGTAIGSRTPSTGVFTNLSATSFAAGSGVFSGNLTVLGNLNVSGSQVLDGVTFANGGIQSPGTISASYFVGDGSGLSHVGAGNIVASGVLGSVQFKGSAGEISASNAFIWDDSASELLITGAIKTTKSIQMTASTADCLAAGDFGKMRFADLGSGDMRLQLCRP